MKIVLTGFMGTGKTSVGEELARRLGYPFVDTDVLIEEKEGMPISLIFKEKGEDYFRVVERRVVEDVSSRRNAVIATGGGIIKDRKNVESLGRRGIIIWLRAEPGIILKRVMLEGGKRPLLDVEEPMQEIRKLLNEREHFYQQSDFSLETNYITPGEAAQELIDTLGLHMQEVGVELKERSYKIVIGRGCLRYLSIRVKAFRPSNVAIVSNTTVFPLYRDALLRSFDEYGIVPEVFLIPDGEEYKDLERASHLYGELLKARFTRDSLLIAFGGGVVGDIAGFVASTYMRGIPYIQVPTTLLAQVDSSVGGKTGVNHPLGKNMIGTFYQPSLVLMDIDTLKTLPPEELKAGIAEVIKYGVIADAGLFRALENYPDDILSVGDSLFAVVKRSCEIKADVVSQDERESGLRAILNFGHTVGHAVETVTGYRRFLHGEAISIGMHYAAKLATRLGMLESRDAGRIRKVIERYGLPAEIPSDINVSDLVSAMEIDKKVQAGRLRFVLPGAIGTVRIVEDVDREIIREVLESG